MSDSSIRRNAKIHIDLSLLKARAVIDRVGFLEAQMAPYEGVNGYSVAGELELEQGR